MRRVTRTAIPFAVVALGLGACSSVAENAAERLAEEMVENAAGDDVNVDFDTDGEGSMSIESSEGTLQFGTGDMPEGFPEGLAVPDGQILSSMSMNDAGDGSGGFSLLVQVDSDDFDGLLSSITSGVQDGGWTIDGTSDSTQGDSRFAGLNVSNGEYEGVISLVMSEDGEINVSYNIGASSS